jgi:hypothetical protein
MTSEFLNVFKNKKHKFPEARKFPNREQDVRAELKAVS